MFDEDFDPGLARLVAAHPAMFRGGSPAVTSHVPPGWYELVDKLCEDIESALDPAELERFECRQIKEKFGTLRFYWRYGTSIRPRVDLLSTEEFVSFEALPPELDARMQMLHELIDAACSASGTICDTCGSLGRLLTVNGWWMTRCPEHTPDADE